MNDVRKAQDLRRIPMKKNRILALALTGILAVTAAAPMGPRYVPWNELTWFCAMRSYVVGCGAGMSFSFAA